MSEPAKHFTASEIGAALYRSPQAVRKALRHKQPKALRIVRGVETAGWSADDLPAPMRDKLEAIAAQRRYRNAEALLSEASKRWQPAIPLNQVADQEIQRASQLRSALMPMLLERNDGSAANDFNPRGVIEYAKTFGNLISERHWYRLFKRTLDRDAGAEDWNRLEIYLPDNPRQKETPATAANGFRELAEYISACGDPHAPTEIERRGIWTLALESYEGMIDHGTEDKNAARQVRDFLFAMAPSLAASRDALLKAFARKHQAWKKAGSDPKALRDKRENNGASFELPEDDRDRLVHRAVFYYRGDIAPAWRDCLRSGFSPAVVERYAGRAWKKSHVPASVMNSIAPEVELLTVRSRGRKAFDAIKGSVTRSYEGIASMQCVSGDDFTLNTYFYIPDGKGWFQLTRGQVILFIDFRSLRILGWALEPRKSYSSSTIRTLCTHVFGEFGVPEVLYFERGLWKTATLLKGKTDPITFAEISQGLREYGILFKHAIRPRTKTVERVGGMFQDIAEAEPGYCGRDERRDAPESLRRQMAEVETRKAHPEQYFYSLDQWNRRIGQLVEQYNADPQQGRILAGMSPDQAFEAHMDMDNPPMQFGAQFRYLLAHDKRLARVTLNGITIQIGKKKFNYRGPEIAHLVGRDVLAWWNPEDPETIVVTKPDRTDPICLARSESPNALESLIDPESGILARELARIEGQASHVKTRYSILKAKFAMPQRKLLVDAQTIDLGRQIDVQRAELTEKANRRRRQGELAQRLVSSTGIRVPESVRNDIKVEDVQFLDKFLKGGDGK
jgi:hypothetical protein